MILSPPATDRLRVFISSTIGECAAERAIVSESVRSISHEPVLFEEVGARPHPPRKLYTSRLEISHIFIGIYRESYGWIAPDMEISGIEDEYRIATSRGIDRLLYVYSNPLKREPKLQALIEEAKGSGVTLAFYSEPQQLHARVRDDLTATISSRFMEQAISARDLPTASEVLQALLPDSKHRLRRPQVEADLLGRLKVTRRIAVTGSLGAGKTVLLSQLASQRDDWLYVDGQDLPRLDLLAHIANTLRARSKLEAATFSTELGAVQEIVRRSEDSPDLVLAVDGASEPADLWHLLPSDHPLVLTSRSSFDVPSQMRFALPPLTREEIRSWLKSVRGKAPTDAELDHIAAKSTGNPLYLRLFAFQSDPAADLSLRELEIEAVQSLPARAKEIVSYLALCPTRLSFEDLLHLVEIGEGPEELAGHISRASGLLKQSRGYLGLIHEHLRETISDSMRESPARHSFFATRLGSYLEDSNRLVAAVHVYLGAAQQRLADRLLERASYEAALIGGGAPAIPIFTRRTEVARALGHAEEEISCLLSLALAFRQTGNRQSAAQALADARVAAKASTSEDQLLRVREIEILVEDPPRPWPERARALEELRTAYEDAGDSFNGARIATIVTAEYINGRDYQSAEKASRHALSIFSEVGDRYGIHVARINLAAALSGLEDHQDQGAILAQEIQGALEAEYYPRERAVLCNLLTRHYRHRGETKRAEEYAREAIEIGERLQIQHVIAINHINLGNVLRDEGQLDLAMVEYRTAERTAVAAGLQDSESSANELMASVFNEEERYVKALHHAQHASAVARSIGDSYLVARAEEEGAIALKGKRETESAIDAYARAAKAVRKVHFARAYFGSLVVDALGLCRASGRADLKVRFLRQTFLEAGETVTNADATHPLQGLIGSLPAMAQSLRAEDLLPGAALAVGDLFEALPSVAGRKATLSMIGALTKAEAHPEGEAIAAATAAILVAQPANYFSLADLALAAEQMSQRCNCLYFKPHSDGAAHWTVRLDLGSGVTISIMQLDDDAETGRLAMIVACLLAGLGEVMRRHILDTDHFPRQEAVINLLTREEFEAHIGKELVDLGEMPKGYAVTEARDVTEADQPPIVVVRCKDFPVSWAPHENAISDIHLLLGDLLKVLVRHLLAKAVEPEVLYPKVGAMIREIGYRSGAVRVHPLIDR